MRPDRFGRGAGRRRQGPFGRTDDRLRHARGGFDVDRPDRATFVGDVIPFADAGVESDPELAALTRELEMAGSQARNDDPAIGGDLRPAPAFSAELRARLLAQLPNDRPALTPATASWASQPMPAAAGRLPGSPVAAARVGPEPFAVVPTPATKSPVQWRLFDQIAAPRWTALAAAAVIVFAAVGLATSRVAPIQSRVESAAGATVSHDGIVEAAAAGTRLVDGDTVSVTEGGSATLQFGASEARLAAGAVVRIGGVEADGIGLTQLAGRVYHRVDLAPGSSYVVTTASIKWTAHGTAFDLDREPITGLSGERVTMTAIQHAVDIDGPDVDGTVAEGRQAIVILGGATPDVSTTAVPATALADPWLIANGRRDLAQGRPLGILAGLELAEADPSVGPTSPAPDGPSGEPVVVGPSQPPNASPDETAGPTHTPAPTPKPTRAPTPTPTRTPEPTPTPTPTPAAIGLSAMGCDGGVVLDWTPYDGDDFARSVVLRSTSGTIPAVWPPSDGVVAVETAGTTNAAISDGFQATSEAGTAYYRALVLGASNQILAKSPVRSAATHAIEPLSGFTVTPGSGDATFGWNAFGGDCVTAYELVWSTDGTPPNYLGAHLGAVALDGPGSTSDAFGSGTFYFRVQTIRTTSLGSFIVAQTSVVQATIP